MSAMVLYPAIDLLGGHCVRLQQGDYGRARVFDDDPVAVAQRWQQAGAEWLHVVDLDGAREGRPVHSEVVRAIVQATSLPVQIGGGLRTEDDVAAVLGSGAARAILGTAAARDEDMLVRCLRRWDERIVVSIDSRGDAVAVAGWLESTSEMMLDYAGRLMRLGVRTLIVTDIERDGTLAGSDSPRLLRLRRALPQIALVAAGGIGSLDDVRHLAAAGLDGAVLGRALYEGAVDLTEALRVVRESLPAVAPVAEE